jgi:hypothetical protein
MGREPQGCSTGLMDSGCPKREPLAAPSKEGSEGQLGLVDKISGSGSFLIRGFLALSPGLRGGRSSASTGSERQKLGFLYLHVG